MKEQEPIKNQTHAELTKKLDNSTLKKEINIMDGPTNPEGQGPRPEDIKRKATEESEVIKEPEVVKDTPGEKTDAGAPVDTAESPQAAGEGGGEKPPETPPVTPKPEDNQNNSSDDISNLQDELKIKDLKTFLELVKNSKPEDFPRLFEMLKGTYADIFEQTREKIGELESSNEPDKEEKIKGLLEIVKRLPEEQGKIVDLMSRLSPESLIKRGEHEQKLLDDIVQIGQEMSTLTSGSEEWNKLRSEKRVKTRELMSAFPPDDNIMPDVVMEVISSDRAMYEEFVSKLIVTDLEDEQHQVRSFYGSSNLEKFIRVSRKIMPEDERGRLINLIEGNRVFHDMNYIIKKNFDQFGQMSEGLLSKHFEAICQTEGVALAIRKYDEIYRKILSSKKRITEKDYQEIDGKVRKKLVDINNSGRIKGIDGGSLQDWEIFRSLIYARNYHRITLRAGEQIMLSELPEQGDPSLYASAPQKAITGLMNALKYTVFRFRINETQGGPEFIDMALKESSERKIKTKNGTKGRKETRLKRLEGTSVDQREFQATIATRGVHATWRNAETMLRLIEFKDIDGRTTNIVQFLQDHKYEIDKLKDLSKRGVNKEEIEKQTEELFKPFIKNTNIALGILLSPSGISLTPELKNIMWKKAAELNPLVFSSLLTRLEVDEGQGLRMLSEKDFIPDVMSFEEILIKNGWTTSEEQKQALGGGAFRKLRNGYEEKVKELEKLEAIKPGKRSNHHQERVDELRKVITGERIEISRREELLAELLSDGRWEALSNKLSIANELRVSEEELRLKEGKIDSLVEKNVFDYLTKEYNIAISPQERVIIEEIIKNGKVIAPDLAKIRQSQAWFLDDAPIDVADWSNIGQFYDRQTGDLGNFNKAGQAIVKIVDNPFGQSQEEILKAFKDAVDGIGNVLGRDQAQDKVEIFLKSYLNAIYIPPEKRALIVTGVMQALHVPTSRAQEIIGFTAPAINEDGIYDMLNKASLVGIIRSGFKDRESGKEKFSNQRAELEKYFKVDAVNRLLKAKVRDYTPFLLFFLFYSLGEQLFKDLTKNG